MRGESRSIFIRVCHCLMTELPIHSSVQHVPDKSTLFPPEHSVETEDDRSAKWVSTTTTGLPHHACFPTSYDL